MAIDNAAPLWLENAGAIYNAREYRRLLMALAGARSGIVNTADLAVSATGPASMSVNVAAGGALVRGTEQYPNQGTYFVYNDAVVNLAIGASSPTNARIDLIVARVRDSEFSGATNTATLEVVPGVAAPGPVEPAVPANSLVLARVDVAAAAASIGIGNITDRRTSTTGQGIARPWNVAWGVVGTPASVITDQGGIVAAADVAGATVTWIAITGRRYKISTAMGIANSNASAESLISITDPANVIKAQAVHVHSGTALRTTPAALLEILSGVAGSQTRKVRAQALAGTTTIKGTVTPTLLVAEDVGPSADPT